MSPARTTALVFAAALAASGITARAHAAPATYAPRYGDIMPVGQIKPGMTGYGLTVFRGTKIEKFEVTVVGVVKKGSLVIPGHDMILVRMSGGPMTQRSAYLIRGMSGSPVYINGKIIGAFAMGEPTSKEPLGGVTPIEDMLEAWDPRLPTSPLTRLYDNKVQVAKLDEPLRAGDRTLRKVVFNAPLKSGLRSHGDTLVLHPCSTMMTFSTTSKAVREKLQKALEPYNVELSQGVVAGRKPGFTGAPLAPGAAFSMMLVTGDLTAGATGTVSYRKGDKILGFGHPFMGIGPIEAPLCSAWIYDVYPLLSGSYKISSPGPVVGASSQDRNFAVSGAIGATPHTIPVTVEVKDLTTGRSRVFHSQAVSHPNLYAALVSASVGGAIAEVHPTPGPAMAKVTTTVDAEEVGTVTRTNVVYDARGIDNAATGDLDDLLGIFTSNPFYPVGIKGANVNVEIESGRRTAQVERIFLKEGKFEPGETAEVGLVIKPYKQPAVTKTVKIAIPANTPTGRYVLQVKGGAVPGGISLGGIVIRPQSSGGPEQAPPVNIRQMVTRYDEREKNNEVVVRLLLPSTAVNVEGQRLSNLPPSLDAVMRSAKSSGVRLERDEVKVVQPTDWVISGQQLLTINVQRKDTLETPSAAAPSTGSAASQSAVSGLESGNDVESANELTSAGPVATDARQFARAEGDEPDSAKPAGEKPSASAKAEKRDSRKRGSKHERPEKTEAPAPASTAAPDTKPAATPAPAETNEKPVGRQPLTWRQTTRADFAKGDSSGLSVTTGGDLVLTRLLKRYQTSAESFVWSLATDGNGGLYAGTGTSAKILHVSTNGDISEFAKLPEISVHSLVVAPDGVVWAATGPNGRVYRIAPDGSSTLALQTEERYALALARDGKGNIFAGTGGGHGSIYRIGPDGKGGLFYKTPEEHVLCLAVDKDNNLYAGTSSNGIVYRINPQGRGSVIYDAAEASISAIGVNSKGDVYAATAPRGVVYKIAADGTPKTVYDKSPSAFTALDVASDDTVYAAGGSSVLQIRPDDTAVPFGNRTDIDILSLAVTRTGTLFAGTGNVAEIYTAAPSTPRRTGAYESVVHDTKQTSHWGSVRWTAHTPPGTHIRVQTRTGNVAEPDATWTAWTDPKQQGDGGRVESPSARFIQYRVTLESDSADVTPALREISISYLPKNQPPKIAFSAPAGGERWAKQQTVKWDASDPDKDTLTYELYYSHDNGTTWQPLPAGAAAKPVTEVKTAATPPSKSAETGLASVPLGSGPPSVSAVQVELDKHPDLPASLRNAILERARKVNADYQAGTTAGAAQTTIPAAPIAIKETSRGIDTKLLPDGTYMLKVVTTDRPSNPVEPRTAEAVSEPFVVCNTPPSLYLLQASAQVRPDRSVAIEGTAVQTLISISAVQFRVDGGEWLAAVPHDGIFDAGTETFTVQTSPLSPGKHTIEVKAFNSANATATDKVEVEVK